MIRNYAAPVLTQVGKILHMTANSGFNNVGDALDAAWLRLESTGSVGFAV